MRDLAPDVLVLNEALWCQPHAERHVDYAAMFGFAHAHAQLYDGHWGNIILSQHGLTDLARYRIYNRGGLLVTVALPEGPLQVATYHPHPSQWPEHKAQDYRALVRSARGDRPLVVCGDFNAISPADQPDRIRLAQGFAQFSKQPERDCARFIEGGHAVFPALQALGLRDAISTEYRQHTMPTRLLDNNPDSRMRIDHAWVNEAVAVQRARVCQDARADIASDHYPLVMDLSID